MTLDKPALAPPFLPLSTPSTDRLPSGEGSGAKVHPSYLIKRSASTYSRALAKQASNYLHGTLRFPSKPPPPVGIRGSDVISHSFGASSGDVEWKTQGTMREGGGSGVHSPSFLPLRLDQSKHRWVVWRRKTPSKSTHSIVFSLLILCFARLKINFSP